MSEPQFNFGPHPPISTTGSIDLAVGITEPSPEKFDVTFSVDMGYAINFINNTTGGGYPVTITPRGSWGSVTAEGMNASTFNDYHVVVTRPAASTTTDLVTVSVGFANSAPSNGTSVTFYQPEFRDIVPVEDATSKEEASDKISILLGISVAMVAALGALKMATRN